MFGVLKDHEIQSIQIDLNHGRSIAAEDASKLLEIIQRQRGLIESALRMLQSRKCVREADLESKLFLGRIAVVFGIRNAAAEEPVSEFGMTVD